MGLFVGLLSATVLIGLTYLLLKSISTFDKFELVEQYFDSYDLPDLNEIVFDEGDFDEEFDYLLFFVDPTNEMSDEEVDALAAFARGKDGWTHGDIIRAFYRAKLGIKEQS
jgi:hypothetical protein